MRLNCDEEKRNGRYAIEAKGIDLLYIHNIHHHLGGSGNHQGTSPEKTFEAYGEKIQEYGVMLAACHPGAVQIDSQPRQLRPWKHMAFWHLRSKFMQGGEGTKTVDHPE